MVFVNGRKKWKGIEDFVYVVCMQVEKLYSMVFDLFYGMGLGKREFFVDFFQMNYVVDKENGGELVLNLFKIKGYIFFMDMVLW